MGKRFQRAIDVSLAVCKDDLIASAPGAAAAVRQPRVLGLRPLPAGLPRARRAAHRRQTRPLHRHQRRLPVHKPCKVSSCFVKISRGCSQIQVRLLLFLRYFYLHKRGIYVFLYRVHFQGVDIHSRCFTRPTRQLKTGKYFSFSFNRKYLYSLPF